MPVDNGSDKPPKRSGTSSGKGWYRRTLPHADFPGLLQFITYRLSDSLPASALEAIRLETESLPPERRDLEVRRRVEHLLGNGHGSCALRTPQMAHCVVETWERFSPERYRLIAWVVMPNHVHVLIEVCEGWELSRIVQSWKSFTGRRLSECHGVGWMPEYWDRFIRDERHFERTVAYIHENPVAAGLVASQEQWPWSSARRKLFELGS
jgi:putative transposase